MTAADDLEAARAALLMINPAPYNAEAPPQGLVGDLTPTELHYVRSNFALPEHDGTLEVGGAVANPTTITLDDLRALPARDQAVTLECARQRTPRHATAADRGAVGRYAVRRHGGPEPCSATCWRSPTPRPTGSTCGSRVPTTGLITSRRSSRRPTRTTSPSSVRYPSPAAHPAWTSWSSTR